MLEERRSRWPQEYIFIIIHPVEAKEGEPITRALQDGARVVAEKVRRGGEAGGRAGGWTLELWDGLRLSFPL